VSDLVKAISWIKTGLDFTGAPILIGSISAYNTKLQYGAQLKTLSVSVLLNTVHCLKIEKDFPILI
jgi:hypothetical protein